MVSVQGLRIGSLGLALWLALGAAGCGDGDDDDDGDQVHDGNARDHCILFVDIVCERSVECFVQEELIESSDRTEGKQECLEGAMSAYDCDRAVAVKESFDACIDQFPEVACDALVNTPDTAVPESCRGVILVQ